MGEALAAAAMIPNTIARMAVNTTQQVQHLVQHRFQHSLLLLHKMHGRRAGVADVASGVAASAASTAGRSICIIPKRNDAE